MPLKLRKSEKNRLHELIDQVQELSDTVDELRAEVNAMKISSLATSKENLRGKINKSGVGTIHKLKKCLEKNLIPVLSRDPTYKVRKKCQQMFSQFPTITSRPANLSGNEHFPEQREYSHTKTENHYLTNKTSSRYPEKPKSEKKTRTVTTPSQHPKSKTKDTQTAKSKGSSSSPKSSEFSLTKPREPYNLHCNHETCNSLGSARKKEHLEPVKVKKTKKLQTKKIKTTATSTSTPPVKVTPKERISDSHTVKHQRSVTFVDKETKIALKNDSSMSSSVSSNTSEHNVQDYIHKKPKTELNVKKRVISASSEPEKKKSCSAQCLLDCKNLDKLPSNEKNVLASTPSQNLRRENKSRMSSYFKKSRHKKMLVNQETQTSLTLDNMGEMCVARRNRNCPSAKRSCFSVRSLSSLTSCSPRSISSFCLGTEELGEGLMHRYYKREPIPEDKRHKKKEKTTVKSQTDHVQKPKLFPSRESVKKSAKEKKPKSQSSRKKRTYVVSSDTPVAKTNAGGQYDLSKEQENLSSTGDSINQEEKLKPRRFRKKWKKPEVTPSVYEGQKPLPEKPDDYEPITVCTNRRSERLFPKLERLSNWGAQKRKKNPSESIKFHDNKSSSWRACTDDTCSLTSNSELSKSDGSVTSDRFDRNEGSRNI